MKKILNILKEVKDNRKKNGRRYPLYSILSLLLLSKLCGHSDIKSAYHLAKSLHYKQLYLLGFKRHGVPSYSAILDTISNLDTKSLESALSKITYMFMNKDSKSKTHLSIDGKSLSGRDCHLVSLFNSKLNAVVGQIKSAKGGGEISAAMSLFNKLDIEGSVITGDAMFSCAKICKKIVKEGGDYVLTLKSNRGEIFAESIQAFDKNPWPEILDTYEETLDNTDHGRIEYRKIEAINWPYSHRKDGHSTIKQVARITRYREVINSKDDPSITRAYIITSMTRSQASAKELLNYNREHWHIENKLHRTKDTLFEEDKQTIRKNKSPQVSSALSNLAITLINNAKKKLFKKMSMKSITQIYSRKVAIPLAMLA